VADPPRIHTEDLRFRGGPRRARGRSSGSAPVLAATLYLPADVASTRPPEPPRLAGVVVGHGAASRRDRHDAFCRIVCAAGLAVLSIDFRGHGESTGKVDGPLHEDIVAAAGLLRSHPLVDGMRLGYRGSSMGGYYGVLAARDVGLAALALICPAGEHILKAGLEEAVAQPGGLRASADQIRLDEQALRAFLQHHHMFQAAAEISCPTLLLHARGDDVVPLADTLRLAAGLAGPAEVIVAPGGDHRSLQASTVVHRRVAAWLSGVLGSPTPRPASAL
jgi:dipeptidyl aminopeptidase/acylaminoacyl peptidase